jgi:O-antigen ligase
MKSEHTLQSVMVCFISGTTLMAIILCLYFIGIIPESAYLQRFTYHSYISYSLFVVVSILMLAFFYKASTTTVTKLVSAVLMLFLAITITQLKGRSAYLALVVLSPWLFVTMFGRHRLIPVLVAVPVTLALLLSSPRVRERLDLIPKEVKLYQSGGSASYTATDGSQLESSIGLRLMVWSDALKIFRHYPLFGAGTGAYQHEANKINPENKLPHPHNSYLFILVNYGLSGIGLYGRLLAVTLKRSWRARDQLSGHGILAFLLVILIGSLTDTQVLSTATGIALGFVAGIPTPPTTVCAS